MTEGYNGFDPIERGNQFERFARNHLKPDSLAACKELDAIEKLTSAARSKEILVNVPKLNIEKKDPLDIEFKSTWEQLLECVPVVYKTPRIEIISKEWLDNEFLPKLKTEKVENEMENKTNSLNPIEMAVAAYQTKCLPSVIANMSERELETLKDLSSDELVKRFEEKKENRARHLDHDFYKRANEYREGERVGQILKGADKYPTPFNPMEWSPKQLIQHFTQENVDQQHYAYGLYEWVENLEKEVAHYKATAEAYSELLKDAGRLTKFLVEHFPEAGNAGDLSVDVAIELLKDWKKDSEHRKQVMQNHAEMMTDLNALAKYMIVHFPNWCIEGEKTTATAKKVLDAFRMADNFNAKG